MAGDYGDVIMSPKDIAHQFIKRVKKDKDACVGITGDEGDGKSTLAVWIIIECFKDVFGIRICMETTNRRTTFQTFP